MGSVINPIQIDKTRFSKKKRKFNRGRWFNGDQPPSSEDSDAQLHHSKNHEQVNGPLVFRLKNGSDCWYFYVLWKYKNTLLLIIQQEY